MDVSFDDVIEYDEYSKKIYDGEIIYHRIEVMELCPYLSSES